MKELRFEEKGTWAKINLDTIKQFWDSNEEDFRKCPGWMDSNSDYRQWPEQVLKSFANELLELAKIAPKEKQKYELFFHAKGVLNKGRLYKEYFRNIPWPYSEEQLEYIENTKREADEFFCKGIVNF